MTVLAGSLATGYFTSIATAQTTSYSPVVGFVKVSLAGTSAGSGYNFVGPSLTTEESYRGKLAPGIPAANTLTVSLAAWAVNEFDTNPVANSHYVEIVFSSNAAVKGVYSDIVSHTANALTTQNNLSSLLTGGETIVIRKHKTVSDLFGAGNESGLGAGEASTADTISVLNPGTSASFSSIYYKTTATLGGVGWRSTTNPFIDQSAIPVKLGDGLLIQRRQSSALPVVLQGYLHEGPLQLNLKQGFNLVDPVAPITNQTADTPVAGPAFTLGGVSSPSQQPSTLDAVFQDGTAATADLINFYDSVAGFSTYYRRAVGQIGGAGWRSSSNPFISADNVALPPAASYLIELKSPSDVWNRPQPFSLTTP